MRMYCHRGIVCLRSSLRHNDGSVPLPPLLAIVPVCLTGGPKLKAQETSRGKVMGWMQSTDDVGS